MFMPEINNENIQYLFEPRFIAIIGASKDQGKIGSAVLRNIISGGYTGRIIPVNPAGGEIEGRTAFRSVADIDGVVDVAVVTIPAKFVFEAVRQCADCGVKYGIIITSGFSEIGNREEENKIITYANERGMRIVGPNVFGIYSSSVKLNATFVSGDISSGHLAMITQSGALGLTMIGQAAVENIGMSAIVSVGNKADIDEADLLQYLMYQDDTHVILMYIEGVRNGEKLVRVLRKATRRKPVVIIKSGRSQRGAMAAASHTGSLAGADDVFDAIIKQCAALHCDDIHSVLGIYCESALFKTENLTEAIENNYHRFKTAGKPIIFSLFGGVNTSDYEVAARRKGVPVSDDVYNAASSLGAMYAYHHYLAETREDVADADIDVDAINQIVADVKKEGRYFLLSNEARNIMNMAGVTIPNSLTAQTLEGAVRSAD